MINVALLGNPNVGKTTIFNAITGLNQYVGNWPGVTIEKREGHFGNDIKITDLPGIYAMDTFSNEEKISKNFIEKEQVDVIVNVVDASNISRNLYLTTQLMKYKKPMVVLLNMIDSAESKGIKINIDKIQNELGCIVIPMVAKKGVDLENLKHAIKTAYKKPTTYKVYSEVEKETYSQIDDILKRSTNIAQNKKKTTSEQIDDIVLNPILAYPIFIGLLYTLFKFTFEWVGGATRCYVKSIA